MCRKIDKNLICITRFAFHVFSYPDWVTRKQRFVGNLANVCFLPLKWTFQWARVVRSPITPVRAERRGGIVWLPHETAAQPNRVTPAKAGA
jgi:hypothetical protein